MGTSAGDLPDSDGAELDGQVAVVTGSSSGIGRAIALQLAAAGADVFIHARQSAATANDVRHQIGQVGRQSELWMCDLGNAANHEQLVDKVFGWRERCDIWVNNAGADVLTGTAGKLSFEAKLTRLWQVDVLATVRLSRLVGARMGDRGGTIINVGWDQAEWGMAGDSGQAFATAKGAVMSFTRSLARSLAPRVRVNGVAPGWIKTKWGSDASPYWDARARGESLLGRWGTPTDVARVVRFLASPAAAFVNGQIVAVNGGMQPWPLGVDAPADGED